MGEYYALRMRRWRLPSGYVRRRHALVPVAALG